jgi:hypothetical protein
MPPTVDIWLGKGSDSDLAVRYINKTSAVLTKAGLGYKKIWSDRIGRSLCELCERPYWRRMWIIQEVCHSNDITVRCGRVSFHWSKLEALYLRLKKIEEQSWFAHHRYVMRVLQSSAAVMVWQRAHWRHPETNRPSLQTLVEVFHTWQCADIRDKVYALLSMADPETTMPPDYSKTALEVYHDVVGRNGEYGTRWCSLLSQVLAIPAQSANLPGRQL